MTPSGLVLVLVLYTQTLYPCLPLLTLKGAGLLPLITMFWSVVWYALVYRVRGASSAPACATRATGTPLGRTGRWMPQPGR